MRPLAEADLTDVVGLAFDVDDTLSTHGRLTAEAFSALTALSDAGIALIAVTGRPLGWADSMAAMWPVAAAVGENGAGWAWRRGRGLEMGYAADPAERSEQTQRLRQIRAAVSAEMPEIRDAADQPARRCDHAFDVAERESVPEAQIAELVQIIERHGALATVSSVHAHAVPGRWDKATGVTRAVQDALGTELDPARWVFVGDSGNDAAAFEFFERSVGVANVRAHLERIPKAPRWVTEAERGAGFVQLARALVEARGDG